PLSFERPRVTGSYGHQPRDAACPFPRTGLRRSPPASASGTSGKAPWARYVAHRLPLGLHKASPRRDYQHGLHSQGRGEESPTPGYASSILPSLGTDRLNLRLNPRPDQLHPSAALAMSSDSATSSRIRLALSNQAP